MNQVATDDFEDKGNIMLMNDKTIRLVIAKILDKLNSKVEFNGNQLSYSDIIMYQGRLIATFLTHKDNMLVFIDVGENN